MRRASPLLLLLAGCATGSPEVRREGLRRYLKQGQYSQLRLDVPLAAPAAVGLEPADEPTERLDRIGRVRKR